MLRCGRRHHCRCGCRCSARIVCALCPAARRKLDVLCCHQPIRGWVLRARFACARQHVATRLSTPPNPNGRRRIVQDWLGSHLLRGEVEAMPACKQACLRRNPAGSLRRLGATFDQLASCDLLLMRVARADSSFWAAQLATSSHHLGARWRGTARRWLGGCCHGSSTGQHAPQPPRHFIHSRQAGDRRRQQPTRERLLRAVLARAGQQRLVHVGQRAEPQHTNRRQVLGLVAEQLVFKLGLRWADWVGPRHRVVAPSRDREASEPIQRPLQTRTL
jgi:hypothetical protein